nr:peptidoglycan-binding domain-containing protein [Nocardioides luti]
MVLAAVLGLLAGVLVAFLVPGTRTTGPSADADPLGLGVPFRDLPDCTGASILVIGFGESRAPLAAAIQDNAGADVSYLRTADSCAAVYGRETQPAPTYVAYLGPYDSPSEACAQRMTPAHRGDNVTRLRASSRIHVQCICELPTETFPELAVGRPQDAATQIWTRALQTTLDDIGRNPTHHINGVYDQRTADLVRTFQSFRDVADTGVTDTDTWQLIRTRACGEYDY